MSSDPVSRRRFVRTTGAAALGASALLAGCSDGGGGGGGDDGDGGDGGSDAAATVAVGPGADFVFDPDEVTVSTGDTVEWTFESAGHNVSAKPDASDEVSIPDGAEPFASYDGSNHMSLSEAGTAFSHTFETAGEYTYVCVPHVNQGMVGTVVVE